MIRCTAMFVNFEFYPNKAIKAPDRVTAGMIMKIMNVYERVQGSQKSNMTNINTIHCDVDKWLFGTLLTEHDRWDSVNSGP